MVAFYFSMIIMAFGMAERPKINITFVDELRVPFEQTHKKLNKIHQLKQEVDDELTAVRGEVEFTVPNGDPFRIIPISDTHLFSSLTDLNKVGEMFEKLKEKNTYGIIMGDLIEGANGKITDHIDTVEIGFGKQIKAARQILAPYIADGKVVCLSTAFNGHEGWGMKYLGIDVVELLAEGFNQPDGTPLRVLYNGGTLIVHLKNGETYKQLVYHAPGGGGSDEINPLGAQRNRLWEHINHRNEDIDGVGGGDWHHRAGVSKELDFDFKTATQKSYLLFSNGTPKGNDPKRPDVFLTQMAKGPTLGPGVQLILNQPRREKNDGKDGEYAWVSYGYQKGEVLYEAAKLWDKAEKTNITKELVDGVMSRSIKPKAEFSRKNSRTETKESRFDTPVYEKFYWNVESPSKIPAMVFLLGNVRYGSTTFDKRDRDKFVEILSHVKNNPFEFVLGLRHFVGFSAAKDEYRTDILNDIVDDFTDITKQKKFLGLMLSGSWLDDGWKARDFDPVRGRPGTYVYSKLGKGVPLYLNKAIMTLKYGNIDYDFLMMDHLDHSGSSTDPFRGLVTAKSKIRGRLDVVVGGHMPKSGFLTTPDSTYVATGWFSNYESKGKSNKFRVPLGGQAVILDPNTRQVIPTSSFLEAKDTFAALKLLRGLKKDEKEKLMNKRVR